jgi:co-chaperonin GroES (HSP10)
MSTVLHPKGNRITVLRDPPKDKSEGGIALTGDITDHLIGTILEMGPEVLLKQAEMAKVEVMAIVNGTEVLATLRPMVPGQRVLYSRFAGTDATVGGQNICILEDKEIIGVLEGEGE